MSEHFDHSEGMVPDMPPGARILDMVPSDDPDFMLLHIDHETKGCDLIATIAYLRPSQEGFDDTITEILRFAIERRGLYANKWMVINDKDGKISDQVEVGRVVSFGDKPTLEDFDAAMTAIRDEDMVPAMRERAVSTLIDDGLLRLRTIACRVENEFIGADDAGVTSEMRDLSERFYRGDEL